MNIYETLNPQQQKGVFTTEGPVLILAGAGSGKTRVLTHRVAYLIQEKGVAPYNIMAITFTNKAAGEMRERINQMIGVGAERIWVSTFHSSCVRILRQFADRLGYDNRFTIYDGDDQKSLMKDICKRLDIDTKIHKERAFLSVISAAKDELISPEEFAQSAMGDFNKTRQAEVYREYQARLKANNAMDFDDLIMKTVELLKFDTEVRSYYQERFHYIMVDEYQDTNTAQFELVRLLASGRENLCVVGDDDQSIYKFRGANIYNILHFEQHYPHATVIKLEQNYRSTGNILNAANGVIANNQGRKEKRLWTEAEEGEKIFFEQFESAYEEADYIAKDIAKRVRKGEYDYGDCAVLYRTNAQSRLLEERLLLSGIPYKIVGGVNFYARKEIKDLLSYLKVVDNAQDDLAVQRIINVPKRGIGATSMSKAVDYAYANDMQLFEALEQVENIPSIGRAASKIQPFVDLIYQFRTVNANEGISSLLQHIIDSTGYVEELRAEGTEEAKARIENIDELLSKVVTYEQENEEPTLSGFLEEVALVADIDSLDENASYVVLMTLHSAKGLEFPNVYLAGMEDGLFPSYMSITADNSDEEIEEERRLCYVGITRAKEHLSITGARMRMVRGETQYHGISRFVKEIPETLLQGSTWEPKPREERLFTSPAPKRTSMKATPLAAQTYQAKNFGTRIQKNSLEYGEGDRVKHIKFGVGTVVQINDGGRDFEVTVEFDTAGRKKMFASFAKLQKV
ncbi:MAG: DNA helicase PcrA [Lachnospiraceae bacterium]|nr:DNA helicase PcrA [Lachnospiraceae bacterium]